jgi:hypothetical protein
LFRVPLLHLLIGQNVEGQQHSSTQEAGISGKRRLIKKLQAIVSGICDNDAAIEVNSHVPG